MQSFDLGFSWVLFIVSSCVFYLYRVAKLFTILRPSTRNQLMAYEDEAVITLWAVHKVCHARGVGVREGVTVRDRGRGQNSVTYFMDDPLTTPVTHLSACIEWSVRLRQESRSSLWSREQ